MENILELKNIKIGYNNNQVLKGMDLEVKKGEFLTILGPSGCGKTTTLKIIAGILAPDEGQVILDGVDITNMPPEQRNINTIFQNYALFPLMTVRENIGYGLKIKKIAKAEISEKVEDVMETVNLRGFEDRYPSELSGGQQQRVAIARALIMKPKVLLLDEPLGALDAELRTKMQSELSYLQKELGITFIFITHDQEEAISMSDRVVKMEAGEIKEIGCPFEIFKAKAGDFDGGVKRVEFVLEDGERVVACRKGLGDCLTLLQESAAEWGLNEHK